MRILVSTVALLFVFSVAGAAELTRLVRLKISAGDLASGAHAAEEYRLASGADAEYWDAIGWLARGAQMLGRAELAREYVAQIRASIPREDEKLLVPYGAAIETEGRLIANESGRGASIRYFEEQLSAAKATSLRSRIQKNIDLLTLEGQPAPEIGGKLEELRGRPTLLYFFAEWCGDCKAQAPVLERIWNRYRDRGLAMVAVTRLYDDEMSPEAEKAKIDARWKDDYDGLPDVPVVVDNEAMIRYGGSATPTFALVDRKGVVRLYTPTRLSEAELSRHIDAMLAE